MSTEKQELDPAERIEVQILGAFLSDVSAHGEPPDYEGYRRNMLRQFTEKQPEWCEIDSRVAGVLLEREHQRWDEKSSSLPGGDDPFDRRLDLIERLVDVAVTNTKELHRLKYRLQVRERE
jgi:hypothetical protein